VACRGRGAARVAGAGLEALGPGPDFYFLADALIKDLGPALYPY
jgi:hypothetical protein